MVRMFREVTPTREERDSSVPSRGAKGSTPARCLADSNCFAWAPPTLQEPLQEGGASAGSSSASGTWTVNATSSGICCPKASITSSQRKRTSYDSPRVNLQFSRETYVPCTESLDRDVSSRGTCGSVTMSGGFTSYSSRRGLLKHSSRGPLVSTG